MIASFTALLFAHVLADFVLQPDVMVRDKRKPGMQLLHSLIVLATAQLATGRYDAPELFVLAAAHMIIDAIKTYGAFNRFSGFLGDQAAHVISLGIIAYLAPDLWQNGAYAGQPWLLPLMAIATGGITAIYGGQYAVGILMRPHGNRIRNNGLREGGRLIGALERGLIFTLICLNQPLGVGFLIAAKSILRFGTASRDQRTAEYVIIGTLASFGWAILTAYATNAMIDLLPPLEIAPLLP